MSADDQRDYAEESYNRELCPGCGSSPCIGGDGRGSCMDADITEASGLPDWASRGHAVGGWTVTALLFCTCGVDAPREAGFHLDADPASPYFDMWVHGTCGRPTRAYLESELI